MKLIWKQDPVISTMVNCFDEGENQLAHIVERPAYCDRGHYHANIDIGLGLDDADKFPRYYMQLETAKREISLFLIWRLTKLRAEPYGTIRSFDKSHYSSKDTLFVSDLEIRQIKYNISVVLNNMNHLETKYHKLENILENESNEYDDDMIVEIESARDRYVEMADIVIGSCKWAFK